MNTSNKFKFAIFIAIILGLILGVILMFVINKINSNTGDSGTIKEQPLYWVAPMDPNYKRDKPGKSPMGMDLIPVYKKQSQVSNDNSVGTITIAPNVVNNLGVRTAVAKKMSLKEDILTVGYVKYDENKLIHIHPRVSGWIDKLYVKATGDPVIKGKPLYSLYSPELVVAQEELVLAMKRNNARLISAAENRLIALQISKSFINNLKRTRVVKQSITFYAPQNGVVDNLSIREGFFVKPGNTLFSIGALDSVWVDAEVFERQAALVKKDAKVSMTLDYMPGIVWHGKVDYIYPTLDITTRTVRLRLEFDNPDTKLLPNMFAQVVIHSQSEDELLLIPSEAMIRTGNQNRVVLALGEGQFKSVEVKSGRENDRFVEILEGLEEGERVVSSAQFLLDSESSKTSDFMRIDQREMTDQSESAWVAAVIDDQLIEKRVVKVSHEAIEKWNMMAMTMNFTVSENVDFNALTPGTKLHMEIIKKPSGMFEIIGTHIMSHTAVQKPLQIARVNGLVNSLDKMNRIANISREAIEKWNRPAATVDFYIADDVDIHTINQGQKIYFEFSVGDDGFILQSLLDNENDNSKSHNHTKTEAKANIHQHHLMTKDEVK